MVKLPRSLALLPAVALLLTACASGANDDPAAGDSDLPPGVSLNEFGGMSLERNKPVQGGTLRIALEAAAEALDPVNNAGTGPGQLYPAIYDSLFRVGADGAAEPELAKSAEPDATGKVWTITLPSGVKFHDGTEFNADAVIAQYTRVGADGSRAGAAGFVRGFEKMEAVSPTKLVITLKQPSYDFAAYIGTNASVNHIASPASVAQWGAEMGFHPSGVGPFSVKSFQSSGDTVLVKNPNYRIKGQPYLDQIVYVTAVDTQSRLAAAIAGNLDLAPSQVGKDLKAAEDAGLVSLLQPTFGGYGIFFNHEKEPLNDVRFREAIIRGVDLKALNKAVFDGLQPEFTGIFTEANPYYVKTDWPSFDPDKAKKLVKEWQADNPGKTPAFQLTTTSPPEFQRQAAIIQQMLSDVGITLNVIVGDQPTMISEGRTGNFVSHHRFITVRPDTYANVLNSFGGKSAANLLQVGDPEVDELLDEVTRTNDNKERADLYAQIQERFAEWVPMFPIVGFQFGWYAGDNVGGFKQVDFGTNYVDVRTLYVAD